jgi:hypothetical protein
LEPSDSLANVLFQITGPAHIPWQDDRWHEILHGYNVWVHVEHPQHYHIRNSRRRQDTGVVENSASVLEQACSSVGLHAQRSSNVAALTTHVTRMLRELTLDPHTDDSTAPSANIHASSSTTIPGDAATDFSNRIGWIGKARATAGAVKLLTILVHAIVTYISLPQEDEDDGTEVGTLADYFVYHNRETSVRRDTAHDLFDTLLQFLVSDPISNEATRTIPEIYDTTVLVLELLLVCCSTQLYQPLRSSIGSRSTHSQRQHNQVFWDFLLQLISKDEKTKSSSPGPPVGWTPRELMATLLHWYVERPSAPARSIAHYHAHLARSVVQATSRKAPMEAVLNPDDGLYESYRIVQASAPPMKQPSIAGSLTASANTSTALAIQPPKHNSIIFDATKGVLILSSSIILLPFRLVSLALGLWGHHQNSKKGYDQSHRQTLQRIQQSNRTKDVLWLSDAPVSDLGNALLLLLLNNARVLGDNHPFRAELKTMADNRWESDGQGLPDLPDPSFLDSTTHLSDPTTPLVDDDRFASPVAPSGHRHSTTLTVNFETLFASFGKTAHTEPGGLLLYTVLQASPGFADAMAARSDLDTLVLPLLRTLYFASSPRHFDAQDYATGRASSRRPSNDSHGTDRTTVASGSAKLSIRNCPFRSQSQLYVIVILLLLFSQDVSFGQDAFRRVMVPSVVWYKERHLKDISLGSVLLLSLLRSLTFNMNRLHDAFLLSNCCAVLMNLAPAVVELHEYAALRLAAVTLSSMKRYTSLKKQFPNVVEDEEDLSTPLAMHGEVSRTLLHVIKNALSPKNMEDNLHLVYALVYHQADFKRLVSIPGKALLMMRDQIVINVIFKSHRFFTSIVLQTVRFARARLDEYERW